MSLSIHRVKAVLRLLWPQVQHTSGSSGWFVCNNDSKTVESDIDDPVEAAELLTKAYVIDTTGKSYVDLAHLYVGTNPATDVKVRAFGFWVLAKLNSQGAIEPYQLSTFYPQADISHVGGGFWAPLFAPVPAGTHEQTLQAAGDTPEVDNNGSSPNYKVKSGNVSYATNGCERAIVLMSAVSTSPTVGCVLARVGN